MAGIQLSGLVSGIDTQSIISQLIQIDTIPVTRLQTQQSTLSQKNTALTTLQTNLQSLQDSVTALNDSSLYSAHSASVSDSLWSSTASTTAAPGTHTISVSQLATSSTIAWAGDISGAISSSNDVSGVLVSAMNLSTPITAGAFTVNGNRVSVATTDSLQDVFQKISDATGGDVTASYDAATDKISLTSASGEVVLGSANDTTNFLTTLKLTNNGGGTVTSASSLGTTNLDTKLDSGNFKSSLTSGAGVLTINGVDIPYNTGTYTLRNLLNSINSSSAGVTASYDPDNDRIVLANKTTGDLGVSIKDTTGNLGSVLGLTSGATLTHGKNAQFTVDGGATRTSTSNSLDETALGVAGLSVTLGSQTTQSVTVGTSTDSAKTAIQNFITAFNAVQTYVQGQTQISTSGTNVSTSLLTGDLTVKDLSRSLQSIAFQSFSSGPFSRLDSMGIDFDGTTGMLKIKDETKLDNALSQNGAAVANFFTASGSGFASTFNTFLNKQLGTNGAIGQEITRNTQNSSKLGDQITTLQRRLADEKTTLTAKFTQMETMQQTYNTQLASMNSILGTTTTSSTSSSSSTGK